MTILKRLSRKKVRSITIIYALLFFTFCSEEKKNDDFLARVNDSYLTREDIASLVDTSQTDNSEINFLIKEWIKNELLFQKAIDEGFTDKKIYDDILLKSFRELAVSLLIKDKFESFDVEFTEQDLITYYNDNKNLFQNPNKTYQLNIANFSDEEFAIKFRELSIESNWQKAVQFTSGKKSVKSILSNVILEEKEIYPNEIVRLANGMLNNEISIVIKDLKSNFFVFQLVKVFQPFEIYPFELVKELVREKYIATKKSELFENFLSELYSKNQIEIKEWNTK
jgi:hypothetical protein